MRVVVLEGKCNENFVLQLIVAAERISFSRQPSGTDGSSSVLKLVKAQRYLLL